MADNSTTLAAFPDKDDRARVPHGRLLPIERDQWHFLDYVRLLSKRRWTAIPTFLFIVGAVAVATYTATPIYEARAQLLIEAETQNVVSFREVIEQESSTIEYYTTQYRILQSRALARSTIEKLKLWNHPEFVRRGPEDEGGFSGFMARALRSLESATTKVLGPMRADAIEDAPKNNEAADVAETKAQSLAIQAFLQHLTITPVRSSRLVDVKFQSTDPVLAASVANALSEAYIDRILKFKLTTSKEAAEWLANQLSDQKARVEESEKLVQQYREQNSALSNEDAQVVQKITELTALVTKAKTDRIQKELVYEQLKAARSNPTALLNFSIVASNPTVQRLNIEVSDLMRRETQLARDFGDQWPEMITLRTALKSAREKLNAEIDNTVQLVHNDALVAQAQEQSLTDSLESLKREALARNRKAIGYQALQREAESNRQIFETLLQRAKETNISSQLKTNNIRLADQADPPTSPVWPNRMRNLLFALFGGFGFAVAFAFGAEYLDNKLKHPEEIQQQLGLRCLGLVPKLGAKKSSPLLNNGVPPAFAEAFRIVRTNVLFSYDANVLTNGAGRSIVVTSTAPGEGKTLVATNLAVGLALAGQRVLLVDADMRRPRVHEVFNQNQAPGLSELVGGHAKAIDTIQPSHVKGLWLLPSGAIPANPAELLSSRQFKTLLKTLGTHFDWVIIDSPPIMAVTDASVIAHCAGGVLFVVAADRTSRPAATKALEQLDAATPNFLGAVLNEVDVQRNAYFYAPYVKREHADYYVRKNE
jgi:capsular exopolysaccharide synthesis family protein